MVIPAELFQVKYAAETRIFLSNFFERITIVTFRKLVFNDIQQEVVLLLCEKKVAGNKGIRMIECESLSELAELDLTRLNGSGAKKIDHTSEKWTKYFLSTEEIALLQKLKQDSRIIGCGEIMKVSVGLVTGLNEFFMLDEQKAKELKVTNYTTPVVSKSNQLKGIVFSGKDFRRNSVDLDSTHLFLPPDKDFDKLSKACRDYIKYGESMDYHKGYKCRIRKRWYITPSLWTPDAFALRQAGDYPKIILNRSEASSTDTIHRVKFKTKVDKELVAVSFLNSLTFAFSEITGRSYGGGVMTFEPTEFEDIRIPSLVKLKVNFAEIDKLIRQRKIESVLDIVDDALLIRGHGFKKEEVRALRDIWKKLSSRRSARGQSRAATNGSGDNGK
jgi:adenine-specific DNA-methyltransferase